MMVLALMIVIFTEGNLKYSNEEKCETYWSLWQILYGKILFLRLKNLFTWKEIYTHKLTLAKLLSKENGINAIENFHLSWLFFFSRRANS